MTVTLWIPVRTVSGCNAREHWRVRAKRVKAERAATALVLIAGGPPFQADPTGKVTAVTFTRISPGELDTDNLASSMKGIRDEIARFLGVSDAPRGGIDWRYQQMKGEPKEHAVKVEIHTTEST